MLYLYAVSFLSSKAVGLYMVMTGTSTFAEFIFNKVRLCVYHIQSKARVMETESATIFVCVLHTK